MTNLFDTFAAVAATFATRPAVVVCGRAAADTITYGELCNLAERTAGLLASAGARHGTRCAILADNDARWLAAYLGILRLGAVAVPLDTAYRADQVRTVLADSGAAFVVCSSRYLGTSREAVLQIDAVPRLVLLAGSAAGALSVDEAAFAEPPLPPCPAGPDDPAVTLYTSGTTSDPKGVVLTHGNLIAERAGALRVVRVNHEDRILGILPLFHALAQVANLVLPLTVGARVVFLETVNSSEMMRVLREQQITALCVVPQFYYLLHERVMERVAAAPFPLRVSFRALLGLNGWLRAGLRVNLGRILFRSVHAALGHRMRIMVSGGSRFDPAIGGDLYRMGFNILQAYGLTECAGAATLTRPGDPHVESVGQPFAGVDIRILEDAQLPRDGDRAVGEVLIRGPIVMAGYHNRPDANAETLRDGWLHSGDLGYLDARGRLHITGRKKEVIVLASGKNIYPEEIEAQYGRSPYIKEICVLGIARPGEPAAERLHAIVVPRLDLMRDRRIVNTREVIRFDVEGLSLGLPHHKRVLSFDVWIEDLPRTTTRKLKRHEIERLYRERSARADRPADAVPWSEADQVWAADPHVARALAAIRSRVRPGTVVAADANLELDLGLDSMERVELLAGLEQAFGVVVPEEEAQGIYTVRELVEAVRATGAGTGGQAVPQGDPWARVLAEDPEDPDIRAVIGAKPIVTPLMFLVMKAVYLFARVGLRMRVTGRRQMPDRGAFIVSPNHQSYLDPFLLVSSFGYRTFRRIMFVGASEYFATPFRRRLARLMNVVPVDPDRNLVRAMQAGALGLRHGKVLVLFPEGERSPDGGVKKFKKGAAILARHLGVPIVPVAIHGVFELWPRAKGPQWRALLPWAPTRPALAFGSPVSGGAGAGTDDSYGRLTEALRDTVSVMWTALSRDDPEAQHHCSDT